MTMLLATNSTMAQTDTIFLNENKVKCAASEAKYYRVFKKITEGHYQQNEYYATTKMAWWMANGHFTTRILI